MEVTKISTTEFNTIQDLFGSRHFYYVEDSQQKGETGYGYVDSEDTIKVIRSEDGYSPGDILDYYNEDFQKRLQHFRETFFPPEQCQNSDQCTDSTQYPYTHNDVFL
ncbi:hypothetical protein KJ708_07700, partial [bacterium]|nr:hypothetical protein [bacterium]MBU1918101.1 hypothetical protein [bacterium]